MTVVKSTGFSRGNRQAAGKSLASHLKYLQYRPRGPEETREDRFLFSKDEDHVQRREGLDDVMQHTSSAVNYHRLVLSPAQDEPISDWKAWTRGVMHDLEDYKGQELHWYAVKHSNTDDPHIHVVIAGSGEDRRTGRPKAVKLYTQERAPDGYGDFALLKESGRAQSGHEEMQRTQQMTQKITREMDGIDQADRTTERPREREESRRKGIDR